MYIVIYYFILLLNINVRYTLDFIYLQNYLNAKWFVIIIY